MSNDVRTRDDANLVVRLLLDMGQALDRIEQRLAAEGPAPVPEVVFRHNFWYVTVDGREIGHGLARRADADDLARDVRRELGRWGAS